MKDELSKHKKKILWGMYGALVLLLLLLLPALGLTLYMLIVEIDSFTYGGKGVKIGTMTFLLGGLLLGGLLTAKFWVLPAIQKYTEEFRDPKQLKKEIKVPSFKAFMIGLCLTVFIAYGTIFGYSGCDRASDQKQNGKLGESDKSGVHLKPNGQPTKTPVTTLQEIQGKDSIVTPPVSEKENADMLSNKEQDDLNEDTDPDKNKSVSQGTDVKEDNHYKVKEELEESKKLIAEEVENALKIAMQSQEESLELMNEAMPIIVNHLNTLSQDEQREMLHETKTLMINQISQLYPPEFQPFLDKFNVYDDGWNLYLDMLQEHGYILPEDFVR